MAIIPLICERAASNEAHRMRSAEKSTLGDMNGRPSRRSAQNCEYGITDLSLADYQTDDAGMVSPSGTRPGFRSIKFIKSTSRRASSQQPNLRPQTRHNLYRRRHGDYLRINDRPVSVISIRFRGDYALHMAELICDTWKAPIKRYGNTSTFRQLLRPFEQTQPSWRAQDPDHMEGPECALASLLPPY